MGDDYKRMDCCQQECREKCFKDVYKRQGQEGLLGVYPYIPGDPGCFAVVCGKDFFYGCFCKTILRSDDPADTGSDLQKAA